MDGKQCSQASKKTYLTFKDSETFNQTINHLDQNLSLFEHFRVGFFVGFCLGGFWWGFFGSVI